MRWSPPPISCWWQCPTTRSRPLVAGLAEAGVWRPGQLVAHTSGAQGIAALNPAAARGVLALALHPVMTFAGRPEDLDRLDGAAFGVTAPDELRPVAEALVVEMGGEPVWVPESARPLYHAALSHGANHLVTLVNDAVAACWRGAGVQDRARLLAPLLSAALDNALRLGDAALTGPVSRGDLATLAAHRRALARAPELVPSYLAMARRTAERALRRRPAQPTHRSQPYWRRWRRDSALHL